MDWIPIIGFIGTVWGGWQALKKVREEKEGLIKYQAVREAKEEAALLARLKDYGLFKEKVDERMTGFNIALEKVADKAESDCKVLSEQMKSVQGQTENKVDKLETRMDTRFSALESELRGQTKLLNDILLGIADLGSLRKTS